MLLQHDNRKELKVILKNIESIFNNVRRLKKKIGLE